MTSLAFLLGWWKLVKIILQQLNMHKLKLIAILLKILKGLINVFKIFKNIDQCTFKSTLINVFKIF